MAVIAIRTVAYSPVLLKRAVDSLGRHSDQCSFRARILYITTSNEASVYRESRTLCSTEAQQLPIHHVRNASWEWPHARTPTERKEARVLRRRGRRRARYHFHSITEGMWSTGDARKITSMLALCLAWINATHGGSSDRTSAEQQNSRAGSAVS